MPEVHRVGALRRLVPALVAAAALGPGAAVAGAVTFGADLGAPADETGTCGATFGTNSCMFFSGAPGPTFYAPASGTVTAVRVRTGDVPQGPMRVVVMRSLYQNKAGDPAHPYYACCFVERYGPTFTPARNDVTTVSTSLPMQEDPTPASDDYSTVAADDFLALAVLAPDVPFPANVENSDSFIGYAPAPDPSSTPAPSANVYPATTDGFGVRVMMNADLQPAGGGGSGGGDTTPSGGGTGGNGGATGQTGTPGTPATAPIAIRPGATLNGSTASIPLRCALSTACRGRVQLLAQLAGGKRRSRTVVVGSRAFTLRAHASGRVRVGLDRAGRRLAAGRRSLTLTVRVTIGRRVTSRRLTLRRR